MTLSAPATILTAFVTVQEGCDKFCTFCVVPYTRGAELSRPVAKILAEVERLADAGVREITLIGQNVNAYHGDGPDGRTWTLAALLMRVAEISGVERLRYTTSHPRDMDDGLIAAHRDIPALMPELCENGLNAIEAYHSDHTPEDTQLYLGLARKYGLRVTGGSDFHGAVKPSVFLGTGHDHNLRVPADLLDQLRG